MVKTLFACNDHDDDDDDDEDAPRAGRCPCVPAGSVRSLCWMDSIISAVTFQSITALLCHDSLIVIIINNTATTVAAVMFHC